MARPKSNNVDYFPCYCKDGKTLYILNSRWGNNGYAFFYKLWKRLGDADFHYIDLRPLDNWEYFRAKMGVSDTETQEILDKLADMVVIDPVLWAQKIIWSDSFVDSVKDVWLKRKQLIPQKPLFLIQKQELPSQNETEIPVSGDHNPQSKVKKSKVKNNPLTPLTVSQQKSFDQFWSVYPNKKSKGQAEKAFLKIDPDEQLLATMIATIERAKTHDVQWLKDNGSFIPHPGTWLNAKGWLDEIKSANNGGNGNTVTVGKSPYIECPRCHAEVLEGQFVEIDGVRYCEKCERPKIEAQKAFKKLNGMMSGMLKSIPAH